MLKLGPVGMVWPSSTALGFPILNKRYYTMEAMLNNGNTYYMYL